MLAQQRLGAVRLSIPCQYDREQADHGFESWRNGKALLGQTACLAHLAVRDQIDATHEVVKEKRLVELEDLAQLLGSKCLCAPVIDSSVRRLVARGEIMRMRLQIGHVAPRRLRRRG